jgi:hypothetical protein
VPFLYRFSIGLLHYRGFDILGLDERLREWHDAVVARPSWKASDLSREQVINVLAFYANPTQ